MAETFQFAFNAICPMVLLMLLGFYSRRKGFFDEASLKKLNDFAFRFGMPALMFCNVYSLESLADVSIPLMLFALMSLLGLTLAGVVLARLIAAHRGERGVIIQNTFRSNFAVVGATMAQSLGGSAGSVVATSLQAPSIIYFNVAAVICLTIYSNDASRRIRPGAILTSILKNPLIQAQLAGVLCLCLRAVMPLDSQGELVFSLSGSLPWLYSFFTNLSGLTTPLTLILLGAQVDLHSVGHLRRQMICGTAARLLLAPLFGLGMALLAGRMGLLAVGPAAVSALLALYGSPGPVAGAVMAEQMSDSGELARQYVVWTTVGSVFSLFLWVVLLRGVGLL